MNEAGLERDPHSKAIVATDNAAYNKYVMQRKQIQQKDDEMAQMKNEISELRNLVLTLLNKEEK